MGRWLDPGFRLIEGGRTWTAEDLSAAARRFPAFETGWAAVESRAAADVAVALLAAERAGAEVILKRHPGPLGEVGTRGGGFAVTLQTSGTTGTPKLVRHDLAGLTGRLRGTAEREARWLLAYDPGSFAGLQVLLTAAASGAVLIAAPGEGATGLARAATEHGATHASATPSLWRAMLMGFPDAKPPLRSITLGGEAADQALLDRLTQTFPGARLRHIYASTEAGALFAVRDGRAGFPAIWLDTGVDGVSLRIRNGLLEVNSPRAMRGLAGVWIDTGDLVEIVGHRVLFQGRNDGRVNVGGVKVSPEAVERRLLAVPGVADVLVEPVANPLTGFILAATVVAEPGTAEADVRARLRAAMGELEPAARPRLLTFATALVIGETGKKPRRGGA
jgi:acyl-coenzyme A synthetase/AMP-(fatty) acid ligase